MRKRSNDRRDLAWPYYSAHHAVRAARGRPSTHTCVACGDHPADDWALRPDALGPLHVAENQDSVGWFSEDIWDYIPLCRLVHGEMDALLRRRAEEEWEDRSGWEGLEGEVDEVSGVILDLLDGVEPW